MFSLNLNVKKKKCCSDIFCYVGWFACEFICTPYWSNLSCFCSPTETWALAYEPRQSQFVASVSLISTNPNCFSLLDHADLVLSQHAPDFLSNKKSTFINIVVIIKDEYRLAQNTNNNNLAPYYNKILTFISC